MKKELIAALVEFQKKLKSIRRTQTNVEFSSRYADLGDVMDYVLPLLTEHGLAVMQFPTTDVTTKTLHIETVIAHTSGQTMSSSLELPYARTEDGLERADAAVIAATLSYGRRIAVKPILGLSEAGEDNDGANVSLSQASGERLSTVTGQILKQTEVDGR